MAGEWLRTTIGAQVMLQRGIDITRKEQRPGTVPVVSSGGVKSYHDTPHRHGSGVVLGRKGTLGTVFFLPGPYWPHDTTLWVRDFHGNDPRFVYYFFKNLDILHLDVGSANPTLNRNHVHPIRVRWPPLDEQRRIAAVLGALDDKIELNRKMNQTLEEMAQALFTSWFIDFDGVPDSELVESELGPIPRGWEVAKLRHHISLDKGLSYKGKFLTETGTPMVNLKCVKPHGGFLRNATKPYSGEFKSRHEVRPGDMVIANTDLTQARDILGCPAFVPTMPEAETIITSHHTFAIRLRDDALVGRNFLYHLLLAPVSRQRCRGFATGTTVLAVPKDAVLDCPFALPLQDRLRKFEEIATSLRSKIETNEDQVETLSTTRDTLLPKLISGEIRVPEAKEAVEAVL